MKLKDWKDQAVNLSALAIGTWIASCQALAPTSARSWLIRQLKMSKTPEKFGKGSEEGIVASEAANNATAGGALIPLIAMGIPGRP